MHQHPLLVSGDTLPLYFGTDIGPELAAEIIDTLSQLSLRTTGHSLVIVPAPELPSPPHQPREA